MVVWALTAGIGIYLLAVGMAAQRMHDRALPAPAKSEATAVVGAAALTMVLGDERPAGNRPAAPEGSPLLEFVHPALALLGLTFWIFYVMTGYRTFAWVAFGVVVATVAAGLSWEAARRRSVRRRPADSARGDGTSFPPHLVVLHGLAALCTSALVVITAVAAR
jgi:O-antigen/teichoic acid export membrane protein